MAFDVTRLQKIWGGGGTNGISGYHYTTDGSDTVSSCTGIGYFNNDDDLVKFRVGDEIKICVPGTQTDLTNGELKQVVDVGKTIVARVIAATGEVECTADIEATTVVYT